VTSTRERQRAAARAKLAKEMAERASTARRKRQRQAVIGAGVALVLVVGGVIWLVTALGDDKTPTDAAAGDQPAAALCPWTEVPAESRTPQTVDVGIPPTTGPPNTGTELMTVDTSFGPVEVTIDRAKAPCSAEAFSFLASKKFWDGTKCHRMFPGMLQCGDPTAKGAGYRDTDGMGGPTFRYANENLPTDEVPPYPEGVVALANSGPDTNGSQFFFIYQDVQLSPDYTVLGKVTKGLDNIKKATAAGHNGKFDPSPGGGNPKSDIEIKSITVTPGA
jgi:peptidyl-prolyl cis-trans isomerase B (cyclophilin B)